MSGFAAIYHTDGAPVDPAVLERIESRLATRGPDEQASRILGPGGNVGLAHAMFRTTFEAAREHQPCTLDGSVWIAGHIRVDARQELTRRLEESGCPNARQATDAELVLHAYQIWGEDCPRHLLGDFSFALWDERNRKLFCARDHLGIRPLFYCQTGGAWIVSNALEAIRLYPDVPDELDDLWVADFLMFGQSSEFDHSVYRAVKRLPPGCTLTVTANGDATLRRYWQLEIGEPVYLKRHEEYEEQFRELVSLAVADRLRQPRTGIWLSGGLDSSTLAATAARLSADPSREILGCTFVFEKLIPDDEEFYVRLTAQRFGFPVFFQNKDDACYDPGWWERPSCTPEPDSGACSKTADLAFADEMARQARVWFYGEGPDNALRFEWRAYLSWLKANGRWGRMAKDVVSLFRLDSQRSIFEDAWRLLRQPHPQSAGAEALPEWISPELVSRLGLEERWRRYWAPPQGAHPWRPWAYASFTGTLWQNLFERFEPLCASGRLPSETRHPFLDLRLLRFLLSVPVVPWARRKLLERRAMNGILPPANLRRPKTALRSDPWLASLGRHPFPPLRAPDSLARYVEREKMPRQWPSGPFRIYQATYLLSLLHWASAGGEDRILRKT
mgnify:CR=1 FL=1